MSKEDLNCKQEYIGLTPELRLRVQEAVDRSFGGDYLYAITSGSIVFGGAIPDKSDIDVLVVLPDVVDRSRNVFIEQAKSFADDYLSIHYDFNLLPDTTFPGEYITRGQVDDAISGRGYEVNQENKLFLSQASEEYYLADPERWYRAWLSMTAFGDFVAGDRNLFNLNKTRAWETIILFSSLGISETMSANSIIDHLSAPSDKWAGSGISQRYFTFKEHEISFVESALEGLVARGYYSKVEGGYYPVKNKIEEWYLSTSETIKNGHVRTSPFLIEYEDTMEIRKHAESKWHALNKVLHEVEPEKIEDDKVVVETGNYSAAPFESVHLGRCTQVAYTVSPELQKECNLTNSDVFILVKTSKDPFDHPSMKGKLFGREHFKRSDGDVNIPIRISSACLPGSLGDTECGCYVETIDYLRQINEIGIGVFVYLPQEAQGRGLRDKVRDHRLIYGVGNDGGKITPVIQKEALKQIHPEGYDIRKYSVLGKIFEELGLNELSFQNLGKDNGKRLTIVQQTGLDIH